MLVLRSASNYTVQAQGQTSSQFLAGKNSGGLSGYIEALNDAYQVGSMVAKELSAKWNLRPSNPLQQVNAVLGMLQIALLSISVNSLLKTAKEESTLMGSVATIPSQ
jgi:Purine nucleoside permease (NUP)